MPAYNEMKYRQIVLEFVDEHNLENESKINQKHYYEVMFRIDIAKFKCIYWFFLRQKFSKINIENDADCGPKALAIALF